jgi:adhesin transport system outer membrane protein
MGPPADPDAQPGPGPNLPIARHGRLAGLDWPKAPAVVPPALEDAVNIVTRTYPTVNAARAELRATAIDLRAAKLQYLPNLSGELAYRTKDTSPDPQVQIDLPIWSGGRIEAGIHRAHSAEFASSAGYLDTVNSLALTTVQTYFDIVRLTQTEQFLTESLGEHRRLVSSMERRVKQDVSPLADLYLARSRTAQVEQSLNTAHSQRLTSLRIMAQLVASPDYDIGPIPWFNPAIDIADSHLLEEQAVAYSPLLRRLDAVTEGARAQVASARAGLMPQLDAEYTYDDFYGHRVGGVLRFQNDATQPAQIGAARIRVDEADQNRRSSAAELRREVASDLIEFKSARDRAVISKDAAESAERVSESFIRQFVAGRRSWLDVMNELREAVDARVTQSQDEVSAMYTAARLMIESGRWRPTFARAAGQ